MKKGKARTGDKKESPEQVEAEKAIARMREFVSRKEEFVNAVKANKDRRISARKKE